MLGEEKISYPLSDSKSCCFPLAKMTSEPLSNLFSDYIMLWALFYSLHRRGHNDSEKESLRPSHVLLIVKVDFKLLLLGAKAQCLTQPSLYSVYVYEAHLAHSEG